MSKPLSQLARQDRDYRAYKECGDQIVRAVGICQEDGDAIKVDIGSRGITKNIYDDATVLESVETLVATYTVPLDKKFDLAKVSSSGDNIARMTVKVNDDVVQKKRTWWTSFNADFDFQELILSAGDKVEVFAENIGTGTADFNATIIGGEYDAN